MLSINKNLKDYQMSIYALCKKRYLTPTKQQVRLMAVSHRLSFIIFGLSMSLLVISPNYAWANGCSSANSPVSTAVTGPCNISGTNPTFTVTQAGSISGSTYGVDNSGTGLTLTNNGATNNSAITGNSYGIRNTGTIATLNNAQGGNGITPATLALTYTGLLPTNYNIIINSATHYGQLSVTSVTGNTIFGIYGGSTVVAGTYADVLQGFSDLSHVTGTSGTYSGLSYRLVADNSHSGYWNLLFASPPAPAPPPPPNISTGSTTTISGLSGYTPVLSGGTLVLNKSDNTSAALTVASAGGIIQHPSSGSATLSGALTGTGGLTFTGTGTTVLTGANNYTGGTTVASGTLQGNTTSLQGNVTNNGTVVFDQASTGTFTGAITGTGKLVTQNTGTLVLTGNNTYTGGTQVNAGSNLSISSGSAIGTGQLDLVGSSTTPATLTTTADTTITNPITVSGDPTFNVSAGTTTTVSGVIADGVSSGDVVVQGGGTLKLTGVDTYTGPTTVSSGSSLALSGAGSIASSRVANAGTLDISGSTNGSSIKSLSGAGNTLLGSKTLTLTNANDSYSGVLSGTNGSLGIAGGTETLSGVNTYSGSTTIGAGSALALSGIASIAASSGVSNAGTFDISAASNGSAIKSLSGAGNTLLGNQTLTLSNANDSYSGVLSGTNGSLSIAGGTETLSGVNTYNGATTVNSGSSLALSGAGSIASSSSLSNAGTFDISAASNGSAIKSLSGAGNTLLGNQALTLTNANDTFSGVLSGTNGSLAVTGGTETLSGVNTYSGSTTIGAGSALALSGIASIAASSGVSNAGTFIIQNTANNVSVAGFSQAASGLLAMNIAPTHNQELLVNGTTSLAGGLTLAAAAGHYVPGHYTLLTSTGLVSGAFSNVAISSFANPTNLGYSLSYDAHDVYLNFLPNLLETQTSLQANVAALQGVYALQTGTVNNSLTYDCNNFGSRGFCVSTGGRYSNASESSANTTSAMIIGGYRINDHLRMGAAIDQNLYNTDVAQIASVRSNTPLMGAFVVWNQKADKTGLETKLATSYNNSDLIVNRSTIGTSESGQGSTALNTLSESMTASYAFKLGENYRVTPYAGVRHTSVSANAYAEQSTANVIAPLSYSGLNQESTSALLGVRLAGQVYKNTTVQTSAGFEEDMQNAVNNYSATGLAGLSAIAFNPNIQRTRAVVNFGASYELAKDHHLGFNGIYRQESFQGADTKMAYVNYSMGF